MAKLIFKLFFFRHQDTSLFKKTDFIADSTFVKNLVASLVAQIVKQRTEPGFNPGSGRSPGEGRGYPLQYSGLENSMDCTVHSPWGCKESDTTERLSARAHTHTQYLYLQGFQGSSVIKKKKKNPPANTGDTGSTLGLGRSPGEENGNPLQYSCLRNPKDREAWWATVHGIANT